MRLFEFDQDDGGIAPSDQPGAINLLMVLNHLINRATEEDAEATISTTALINMVKNTGALFDYAALVSAYENVPAVSNAINDLSKDTVRLSNGEPSLPDRRDDEEQDPALTVSDTAQRAATKAVKKGGL